MAVIDDRRPPAQQVITPSAARPPLMSLPPRTKLAIMGADLMAMFLAELDETVVGTALLRIVT